MPAAMKIAVTTKPSAKALTEPATLSTGPSFAPWCASRLVSTVAMIATPKLCATCRVALKSAVARPVSAMLIPAKAAVCRGTSIMLKPIPRANIAPRTHQRSVSRSIRMSGTVVALAASRPTATSRRGPTIG